MGSCAQTELKYPKLSDTPNSFRRNGSTSGCLGGSVHESMHIAAQSEVSAQDCFSHKAASSNRSTGD